MELREFICEALVDVVKGIEDAQREVQEGGSDSIVSPRFRREGSSQPYSVVSDRQQEVHLVNFDVAVTVSTSGVVEAGAKAKISVFGFGGEIGSEGNLTHNRGRESRIQFAVPVAFPRHNTTERKRES